MVEVTVPNLEISSTDLRARAADGRPLDYLVPEAAVRFIRGPGYVRWRWMTTVRSVPPVAAAR